MRREPLELTGRTLLALQEVLQQGYRQQVGVSTLPELLERVSSAITRVNSIKRQHCCLCSPSNTWCRISRTFRCKATPNVKMLTTPGCRSAISPTKPGTCGLSTFQMLFTMHVCCAQMLVPRVDGGQRAAAYDEEDDLGDFIDDDMGGEDWRLELQSVTGYDPSKYVTCDPSLCTSSL